MLMAAAAGSESAADGERDWLRGLLTDVVAELLLGNGGAEQKRALVLMRKGATPL